jgi:hypothetical protein
MSRAFRFRLLHSGTVLTRSVNAAARDDLRASPAGLTFDFNGETNNLHPVALAVLPLRTEQDRSRPPNQGANSQ